MGSAVGGGTALGARPATGCVVARHSVPPGTHKHTHGALTWDMVRAPTDFRLHLRAEAFAASLPFKLPIFGAWGLPRFSHRSQLGQAQLGDVSVHHRYQVADDSGVSAEHEVCPALSLKTILCATGHRVVQSRLPVPLLYSIVVGA